ncbi:hypothetical protein GZ77_18125 [Endozoicomonas montiporae]|uniref:Uncharacterized protein n=2 Tax=Endozoicomonas montiporae TaxID=1027273 RepID=A0A081N1X1_9GAMM|nr:hypothetical protein [Endozoicomonas montiporae]AMO58606.1 hypothetical protein EZMO1_4705 [Endozoicomonas montiporae CL-33]KEQ12444.1 hypothetical protein GZ77_18125 [Endozoicomonas montiporae]
MLVDNFEDVGASQDQILSLKDAVTLVVRECAYSPNIDELTIKSFEDLFTEKFLSDTSHLREKIQDELLEALREGDINSDNFYSQKGLFNDYHEPELSEIFISPWDLGQWIESKGYTLSDYWTEDLQDLFLEMDYHIGREIRITRDVLSVYINAFKGSYSSIDEESPDDEYSVSFFSKISSYVEKCLIDHQKQISFLPEKGESVEPSDRTKESYLTIIGALVTVLAELDDTGKRPLERKKMKLSSGRISAESIRDVLLERFKKDRYLKSSERKISEALKLIQEYN